MAFPDDALLVSLHTADGEVSGGDPAYARQSVSWSWDGAAWASTAVTFDVPEEVDLIEAHFWTADGSTMLGPYVRVVASTIAQGFYTATFLYWEDIDAVEIQSQSEGMNAAELYVEILDKVVERAPTSLTIAMVDGVPNEEVRFYIDEEWVFSAIANAEGDLEPTSIPVPEIVGEVGEHELTVVQTGRAATATFTIRFPIAPTPQAIGQDADPVQVDGTLTEHGTRRWVLQDLLPGGLGSWVMPKNPKTMTAPAVDNQLNSKHTTARSTGQYHVTQGGTIPREFSFAGLITSQEEYDQLQAYRNLNRRFYIIDHHNRAWQAVITDIDWNFRLQTNYDGEQTDWAADYQATAVALNQNWRKPQ